MNASPSVVDAAVGAPAPATPTDRRAGGFVRQVWTVLEFELRKSRTWKRMLVWGGVAMFPAVIIFLMLFAAESMARAGDALPRAGWVTAVFVMACEMVVILNALLWVAPIVQTELEGKTWLYIVTRPYGRFCLVLGKLLNGLVWTLGAGLLALALVGGVAWGFSLPVEEILGPTGTTTVEERPPLTPEEERLEQARLLLQRMATDPRVREQLDRSLSMPGEPGPFQDFVLPPGFAPTEPPPPPEPPFTSVGDVLKVGGILATLTVLGGVTYCSLFCGIGCIAPRRAMLIAFSYTLIFETVVAFVPAIVNRLTIQYHLRCLLNRWVDLEVPLEGQELFFSDWPAWWHVAVLAGMVGVWNIVSLTVIHCRQYVMTDEA